MGRRIVICSNFYPPHFVGGAELAAHQQARTLRALGWDVLVFAGDTRGSLERHALRHETFEGVPICRIGLLLTDVQLGFVNFVQQPVERRFDALLSVYAPDVVHFHNPIGLSIGLAHVARRRGIRTVLTLHDHWAFCHKQTRLKWEAEVCRDHTRCADCSPALEDLVRGPIPIRMRTDYVRMQLESVDTFVTPSRYLRDAYVEAGFCEERFRIVWYGVDVGRFERIRKTENAALRFSFVGHLGEHKGVRILLDALALLPPDERLVVNVVGEGYERRWYERHAQELGRPGWVRFWGQVGHDRLEEVYRETDVLVLPSIWPENQPLTLAEAMASRTAVVASRIGGIPELVDDGRTGYLFEPGSAKELAEKMAALLGDRSRATAFGENGFHRIAGNTLEKQVRRLVDVYGEPPPPGTVEPARPALVVCAGARVDPQCAWAVNAWSRQGGRRWRFVMSDWLADDQLARAVALWVVDRAAGLDHVLAGLRHGLPLLVPEDNAALRDLCVSERCGLYYREAAEARRCLDYLNRHEAVRRAMGENARELARRLGPSDPAGRSVEGRP